MSSITFLRQFFFKTNSHTIRRIVQIDVIAQTLYIKSIKDSVQSCFVSADGIGDAASADFEKGVAIR